MWWTVLSFISSKRQKPSSIRLKFICSFTSNSDEDRASEREKERNWKEDKSRRSWNGFALAKCDVFLKGNDIHYTHTLTHSHIKKNICIFTHRMYQCDYYGASFVYFLSFSAVVHHTTHVLSTRWTGSFKWIGKNVLLCVYIKAACYTLAIATQFAMHGLALTGETRNYERTNKRKKAYSINNRNKNSAHIKMNAKRLNISMDLCWSRIIVCI